MRKLLVAFFLLVALLAVPAASAQSEGIYISDVNVTPETPQVGETVTVTTTVRNGGEVPFDVSQVRIVRWEGSENPGTTSLGTLGPGEEIDVPITLTFGSDGTKEFYVRASGTSGGRGVGTVRYPVSFDVRESSIDVDASADEAAVDAWSPINVDVSNGGDTEIRGLRITADGHRVRSKDGGGFLPTVAPGESNTTEVLVTSDSVGSKDVTVSVDYTNADGNSLTAQDEVTVDFTETTHELSLRAESSESGIEATVTNLGNAAVQDVRIRGGTSVEPVTLGDIDARASETVEMNVTGVTEERELELTATYDLGDESRTAETTIDYAPRSNIVLTGVSTQGGSTVTLTGSTSNVGVQDAEGVLVKVAETPNVEPVPPQPDYFVGTVPASDFGTFELNARVTGNVSEIPVVVSYVADGQRYERVQNVTYGGGALGAGPSTGTPPDRMEAEGSEPSSSGPPTLLVVIVILGVAAVVGYGWRKRG